MSDEKVQQQISNFGLNLPGFDFVPNENTGELDLISTVQPQEQPVEEPQLDQPVESNQFTEINNRFNVLQQQNQTLANAITLLLQAQRQNVSQQPLIQEDVAQNLFGDAEKGNQFIDNLTNILTQRMENVLNQRLAALNPVLAQQQVQNEYAQFSAQFPDVEQYAPIMQQIYQAAPQAGWNLYTLYAAAKAQGIKKPTTNNNQQQNNVQKFPQRNLPDRIPQQNAEIQQKQVSSFAEAMDAALEELKNVI